jgi:hypothetical protein
VDKDLFLEAALYYRNTFKWSVIPVKAGTKDRPLVKWAEFQRRLPTVTEIVDWWIAWPMSNIAVITGKVSNLMIIDHDTYKPEYLQDEILRLIPDSLETPCVVSPQGGHHQYFLCPEKVPTIGAGLLPALDYRCEGGFIIAPPSTNGDGKRYEWVINPKDVPLAKVPDSVLALIASNNIYNNKLINNIYIQGGNENPENSVTSCDINLNKGTRDQSLFHVANLLTKGGAKKEETLLVLNLLAKHCNPPFPEKEIVTKCHSALERAERKERNIAAEVEDFVSVTSGDFSVTSCDIERHIVTKEDRAAARKALSRLKAKGIIEKAGEKDGWYRRVEKEFDFILFDEKEEIEVEFPVKLPLGLNDYAEISQGNIILVAGEFNSGKGHPDGTRILGENGWVDIKHIKKGDKIYSQDGTLTNVTGVFPRGDQQCFEFRFNDRTSIITDFEHLWSVLPLYNRTQLKNGRGKKNLKFNQYETIEAYKLLAMVGGYGKLKPFRRFRIPKNEVLQFPKEIFLSTHICWDYYWEMVVW